MPAPGSSSVQEQEDLELLPQHVRKKLLSEIEANDQSNHQVRAVLFILKDALNQPLREIHEFLMEMLPLDVLFIEECFIDYRVFSVVRMILGAAGVQLRNDKGTLISIKVAMALYTSLPDSEEAIERVNENQRAKRRSASAGNSSRVPESASAIQQPSAGQSHVISIPNFSRNKATVVSSFKEEEKFSGSVSGKVPLHRIRNRFMDALSDQSIPKEDHVKLLHCCLTGLALDYYYKSIRGISTSLDQAFQALEKQFNSMQHQAQARTYLNNMTIGGIKKEKNCATMEALETAHNRSTNTVPNCGKEYQHDLHYCDFLERTVRIEPWAQQVIQARLTPAPNERFDYNTFYSKLCAALTSYECTHPGAEQDVTHKPEMLLCSLVNSTQEPIAGKDLEDEST